MRPGTNPPPRHPRSSPDPQCHSTGPMTVTVMIVDDHSVFRAGLRSILDEHDDLTVVADAGTADDAITAAETIRPDVILLDIGLPGMNGLNAAPRIRLV